MTSGTSSVAPVKSPDTKASSRNPWTWIPTLYLAEGLPYVVVMTVSVIMYKGMGISNTDIALYTSWLYLAWVIKPLWSPVVDILKTRRLWIWVMQLLIGGGLAGVALTIPTSHFFQYTLAFLWLLAFSSATHDIAADGFYMLATTEKEQAFFVGIRSTFYRIAMISGQGLLVILAGVIQSHTGLPTVNLEVKATTQAVAVQNFEPAALATTTNEPALNLVTGFTRIEINPQPVDKAGVNTLLANAKQWNAANGFTRVHQMSQSQRQKNDNESWWKQNISGPLGNFLREHFGPKNRNKGDTAGNLGFAYLRLSKAPEKEIVVSVALGSGDKSISVAEGSRLVFDDQNWNKVAAVVFQLDPKLHTQSSATYEIRSGNIALSWVVAFSVLVGLFLFFGIYHKFMLPRPDDDREGTAIGLLTFLKEFFRTFGSFFRKKRVWTLILFLLLYRFAEAQLGVLVQPFLLDPHENNGMGLTTSEVGFTYGTIGVIALLGGGLLGGMLVSKHGLKSWLWPMVVLMHLPDVVFVYLAYAQPDSFAIINFCVAIEQFGYGFGFTAYMLYMIYIARGQHETAHYAICTGFMALGMMLPRMVSGWLQDAIGYQHFFLWVMLATIPGFLVVFFVPLEAEFGKKNALA